jgi:thioredoxin-related protein
VYPAGFWLYHCILPIGGCTLQTKQKVGNKKFNSASLKKNVPAIIMFFSPGCDHCIHQFEDMVKRMKDLKSYHIIMATYQPVEELAEFNKKYQIAKYPNIVTGRDANYFLPPFYEIRNFPYFAFYNKSGKLTGVFEGNMSVDNIIRKLK